MNKKLFLFLFLGAVACQGITEEVPVADKPQEVSEVLYLTFGDDDPASKVNIASVTGKFSWTDGDKVAVWYQNGNSGSWSEAPISANTVTMTGVGTRAKIAVYPAGAKTDYNFGTAHNDLPTVTTINYPAEIDLTGRGKDYSPMPMIALNDPARNGLKFYHVGGLIRFRLHGIPAETMYIQITSNADPICGEFPVAIPTGNEINAAELVYTKREFCTLFSENQWNNGFANRGQVVRIKISETPLSEETDNITINLPVPMGVYENITVTALGRYGEDVANGSYGPTTKAVIWDCERATGTHLKNLALRPGHPMINPKYVPGKFSVSPTKQVWFASGNLVVEYNADTDTKVWAFEDNQYDYSFGDEGDASYSVPGKTKRISHFGWATAGVRNGSNNYGYDPHHEMFQPYSIGGYNCDYNGVSPWYSDNYLRYGPSGTTTSPYSWGNGIVYEWGDNNNTWNAGSASDPLSAWNTVRPYCEWGVHFDDDGYGSDTLTDGSWYTLSATEWAFLIGRAYSGSLSSTFRKNAGGLVGMGSIIDEFSGKIVCGYIILPDDWERPVDCTFRPNGNNWKQDFSANMYTIGDNDGYLDGPWSSMQEAGAVFLPAAGSRYAETPSDGEDPTESWRFSEERLEGYYWTSSGSGGGAYPGRDALKVYLSAATYYFAEARSTGCCVRLVHN